MRVIEAHLHVGVAVLMALFSPGIAFAGFENGPVYTADAQNRAVILLPMKFAGERSAPLPIVLRFAPSGGSGHGLLPGGWSLPLFETQIVQEDERTFRMEDFTGYTIRFLRVPRDHQALQGSGGWSARIDGLRVDALSPEGWQISFLKGRPVKLISPEGGEYVYAANARTLLCASAQKAVVALEMKEGQVAALRCGDAVVSWDRAKLPVFGSVGGRAIVSALVDMPQCLKVDGKALYDIHLEPGGGGVAHMTIQNRLGAPRTYGWDTATGAIRVVNEDWISSDPATDSTITDGPLGRRIDSGASAAEPYRIDESGTRTSWASFPRSSGASGLRKVTSRRGDVAAVVYERSVDERGRTLRERDLRSGCEDVRLFHYDGDQVRTERFLNQVLVGREVRTPDRIERTLVAEGAAVTVEKDEIKILWKK